MSSPTRQESEDLAFKLNPDQKPPPDAASDIRAVIRTDPDDPPARLEVLIDGRAATSWPIPQNASTADLDVALSRCGYRRVGSWSMLLQVSVEASTVS